MQGADPDIQGVVVCGCLDVVSKREMGCPVGNCQSESRIQEIMEFLLVGPAQVHLEA